MIDINVDGSSFTAEVELTQFWYDSRFDLNSTSIMRQYLVDEKHDQIWKPEIVFENAVNGELSANLFGSDLLVIASNGRVARRVRAMVKFRCLMNLLQYPYDDHKCYIVLRSSEHKLRYCHIHSPFLKPFSLEKVSIDCLVTKTNSCPTCLQFTVEYLRVEQICERFNVIEEELLRFSSCIRIGLYFETRKTINYILRAFPSLVLIIIVFCSFLIPVTEHTSRVCSILVPFSGLMLMIDTNANFATAANIWIFGCTVFAFFAFVEYLIALFSVHLITNAVEEVERGYNEFLESRYGKKEAQKPNLDAVKDPNGSKQTSSDQSPLLPSQKTKQSLDKEAAKQKTAEATDVILKEQVDAKKVNTKAGRKSYEKEVSQNKSAKTVGERENNAKLKANSNEEKWMNLMRSQKHLTVDRVSEIFEIASLKSRMRSGQRLMGAIEMRSHRKKKLSRNLPYSRLKLIWNLSYVPADISARISFPIAFALYAYFYFLIYIM
ncbi:Glycine receptor subunit alpha-2-like protein [Dinothrombium tinctorium]|uniref:Glycine receptor subunit alpha-2-like protein n=1 Tax=Dinothrombium tinctorium TaxID=1965070 RepID=A0A443R111_9ACAR|nr:Glycine receptor subunit alpha-2-like protein [Dinothrombium tinctorium]